MAPQATLWGPGSAPREPAHALAHSHGMFGPRHGVLLGPPVARGSMGTGAASHAPTGVLGDDQPEVPMRVYDALKLVGNEAPNALNVGYFRDSNVARIQRRTADAVRARTGYVIGEQSPLELMRIMANVYVTYASSMHGSTDARVDALTALVVEAASRNIVTNLTAYALYARRAAEPTPGVGAGLGALPLPRAQRPERALDARARGTER